jgi:hypothetical protein
MHLPCFYCNLPSELQPLAALRLSSTRVFYTGVCAPRLIDKKNARRYDDCISYSLVSAKKALKAAGLCQDDNPDAVAKLDKTRAGARVPWSRSLDSTWWSRAWCALLGQCLSSAKRVSFRLVHMHCGQVQDAHFQAMLWWTCCPDARCCHNHRAQPQAPVSGMGMQRGKARCAARAGVLIGSGMGGLTIFQDGVKNLVEKGYKKITPFFIPYAITNMCAAPRAARGRAPA